MQLLLHKIVSQSFLNRLFEAVMLSEDPYFLTSLWGQSYSLQICYIYNFVNTLSFMDEYIAGRSNVVILLNLGSI